MVRDSGQRSGHWRTLICAPSEMGRLEGFEEKSDPCAAVLR